MERDGKSGKRIILPPGELAEMNDFLVRQKLFSPKDPPPRDGTELADRLRAVCKAYENKMKQEKEDFNE